MTSNIVHQDSSSNTIQEMPTQDEACPNVAIPVASSNTAQPLPTQSGEINSCYSSRPRQVTQPVDKVASLPPAYLSDMLERIEADPEVTETQRRDLRSAINRLIECTATRPENIVATSCAINQLISDLNSEKCGVRPQTYRNMLSGIRRAFRRYCPAPRSVSARGAPLPAIWQEFKRSCPDKKVFIGLHSFIAFCAALGIQPNDVSVEHFELFAEMVQSTLIRKNPQRLLRQVADQWNRAAKLVPGWPQCKFPVPEKRKGYTHKLETFPASFREELENWQKARSEPDLMSDDIRAPLKPSTISSRQFKTLQIASALAHMGVPQENITSLSTLIEPSNMQKAMTFFLQRAGNKRTDQIASFAIHLSTIARECCAPDEKTQKALAILCRKLANPRHGMTEKNRRRLVPFQDIETARKLLDLPAYLVAQAAKTPERLQAASLIRTALCIELLLFCVMRASNLANLDKKHFISTGSGRKARTMLVIPAQEVKNNIELVFELQPATVKLMDLYMAHRSVFSTAQTTLLFPARNGKPVSYKTIGAAILRTTEKFLGHKINTHLFRHLMGMLYLIQNPGNYEVVRRVLAHKNLTTAIKYYLGQESAAAIRHFDDTIIALRSPRGQPSARRNKDRS